MQSQLLKDYPSEQVRVYAVWLRMYPANSREQWDPALMPDPRVLHFWDDQLEAARWFAREVDGYEGVSWDMYYLYGPQAVWKTVPSPLTGASGPIYPERETLIRQVDALLGK